MKKLSVIFASLVLFAGVSFAQTAQKATTPTKTTPAKGTTTPAATQTSVKKVPPANVKGKAVPAVRTAPTSPTPLPVKQ
jgi:hypothetical protein